MQWNPYLIDPLVRDAVRAVVRQRRPSVRFLRMHFGIGSGRAGRMLEAMEEYQVVSPKDASGRRKVVLCQSNDITIRFPMTKDGGAGRWPAMRELSAAEVGDPSTMCRFHLRFDPYTLIGELDHVRFTCEVLYDGVTCFDYLQRGYGGERHVVKRAGLWVKQGSRPGFFGYPAPIIRFRLSRRVSVRAFVSAVEFAEVEVMPQARRGRGGEPFLFVDANGYTDALSDNDAREWRSLLREKGVYSGRRFTMAQMERSILATLMRRPALPAARTPSLRRAARPQPTSRQVHRGKGSRA